MRITYRFIVGFGMALVATVSLSALEFKMWLRKKQRLRTRA